MRDPQPHASSSTAPVPGLSSKAFPPPPPIDAQWKQVQQFPEEDGDEWEEEVEYLTLDLGPSHDHMSLPPDANFQLLGLNSPNPFLKVGGQFFMGTHEHLIGTELIMQKAENSGPKPRYEPLVSLTARVRFRPVTLEPVAAEPPETIIHMRHWASKRISNKKVTRAKRPKATKATEGAPNDVPVVAAQVAEVTANIDPSLINLTNGTMPGPLLSARHDPIASQSNSTLPTTADERSTHSNTQERQNIPALDTVGAGQQAKDALPEHVTDKPLDLVMEDASLH